MRRRTFMHAFLLATLVLALGIGSAVARDAGPETRFAFVARGDVPADAIAAAPIAARLDAPVLLTRSDTLVDAAATGLVDQGPDVVVLAGGELALSAAVFEAVEDAVPDAEVRRVSGSDRFATATALAQLIREYEPAFAYDLADGGGTIDVTCPAGEALAAIDADGTATCIDVPEPTEDTNAYGITCAGGEVLTGIGADGTPTCAPDADTDTDTDTNAFGISCPGGEVLTGIDGAGAAVCAPDADTDTDTNAFGISCAAGQVIIGIDGAGAAVCAADAVDGGDADLLDGMDSTDFITDDAGQVGAADLAAGSVRVGPIPMTFVNGDIDLFGSQTNGACTIPIGQNAPGAVADNQAVVTSVSLFTGGANPGWVIEGLTSDTDNVANYRICNYTGSDGDAPRLRFSLFTIGL